MFWGDMIDLLYEYKCDTIFDGGSVVYQSCSAHIREVYSPMPGENVVSIYPRS